MSLVDLPFKPGFYSDSTDRTIGKVPTWKGGNRVRFYAGFPETLGGWVRDQAVTLTGVPRAAHDWQTLAGLDVIAVGTHSRLQAISSGVAHNITPARTTGTLTDPFSTTDTLPTVNVFDAAHGAAVGASVSFSGAAAVGGITIDGEYEVTAVVDVDNYTITHSANATSTAGPGGGAAVGYVYCINPGYVDSVSLTGVGIGPVGGGTVGTPRTVGDVRPAQLWSLDNWGEDLIACFRDGSIYVWDASLGFTTRSTLIAAAPTPCKFAFVSQEDRHLVALGADGDPLYIRWCSQEDYTAWTPSVTNTAGDKRLDQGNQILSAVKLRGEHVIFTDAACFSMQFVGPPFTFGFRSLGANYGVRGPNAVREYAGGVYWMGARGFYAYDGTIRSVPCPVLSTVFDDINAVEDFKIHTAFNHRYNEIWWFYPSAGSAEIDRYVAFNPLDGTWVFGALARTVMVADSDVFSTPYAFGADGAFYDHETGTNDDAAPLGAYIESGDIELALEGDESGNSLAHISKYIPDFEELTGTVQMTLTGKKYPQDTETQVSGPHNITSATRYVNPRMRCRQIYMRFEAVGQNSSFRQGLVRYDLIPHGGR